MSKDYQPCTVDGGHVKPCKSLAKAFDHDKSHKSVGVHLVTFTDLHTGKPTRTVASLNTTSYKPNGVVMNFCPFCGERILGEEFTSD